MVDSRGILSVLDRFRRPGQGRWVPALDTNLLARKQGKDETYWPVGIVDEHYMAVIVKVRWMSLRIISHRATDLDPYLTALLRARTMARAFPARSFRSSISICRCSTWTMHRVSSRSRACART